MNLYFQTSQKSIALVSTSPWRRIIYSSRRNSRGRRSIVRSPRLAVRVRRSSCRGPTLRTVFWLSVGGRRSSTSLASNSATATTLAGFIFIGRASVLENRDEAERISSALLSETDSCEALIAVLLDSVHAICTTRPTIERQYWQFVWTGSLQSPSGRGRCICDC